MKLLPKALIFSTFTAVIFFLGSVFIFDENFNETLLKSGIVVICTFIVFLIWNRIKKKQ